MLMMQVSDMNRWNIPLAVILLLCATVFATGSANADGSVGMENSTLGTSPKLNELVPFVESALVYAQEFGKDRALEEFSNKTGSFFRGELYIYAYDFNGTNLAHPIKPEWIGKNKLNETDSNGILSVRNTMNAAREGKGFTYFIFPNPAHDNQLELKIGYAVSVDDDWWLGSGSYLDDIPASFDPQQRDELVAFVDEALAYARENGRQKALAAFNDPSGNFTRDSRYILAYDYQGKTLALPHQPELIGKSRMDDQDPNGVYVTRQFIDAARRGKGFLYYIYPDPSRNMSDALKLSYVADVDGSWFIGSGIYARSDDAN